MKIVLSNAAIPMNGAASIPLPIRKEDYDSSISILNGLEIGDAIRADCKIEEIIAGPSVMQRLVGSTINIEEMDYLVKRMESFDKRELAQFSALVVSQDIHTMKDLINLTFSFQGVTVIQDFTDLEEVGSSYYLDKNYGVSVDEYVNIDFTAEALKLLQDKKGKITPYGVIYDSDFHMKQLYDAKHFPQYHYEDSVMNVEVCTVDDQKSTSLCLPMSELQLERAMKRGGCHSDNEWQLRYLDSSLPEEADAAIHVDQTSITELNNLCQTVSAFSKADMVKFGAAITLAKPSNTIELRHLAEQLDLFEFIPDISTPKEYGKHMICDTGHFEYDENLTSYYDFEKYGREHIEQELGEFNHHGYISYHGFVSIEEVLEGIPSQRLEQSMGGMNYV